MRMPDVVETFDVTLKVPWPSEGVNIAAMPPEAWVERYITTMLGGGLVQVNEEFHGYRCDAEASVFWRLYVNRGLVLHGAGGESDFEFSIRVRPGDRLQLFVFGPPQLSRVVVSLTGFEVSP